MKKEDLRTGMYVKFAKIEYIRLVLLGFKGGDVTCNFKPIENPVGFPRMHDYYRLDSELFGEIEKVWNAYGELIWERKTWKPEIGEWVVTESGRGKCMPYNVNDFFITSSLRKATKDEILAEAARRGYVNGVIIKCAYDGTVEEIGQEILFCNGDICINGGAIIYDCDLKKWAIIYEPKK